VFGEAVIDLAGLTVKPVDDQLVLTTVFLDQRGRGAGDELHQCIMAGRRRDLGIEAIDRRLQAPEQQRVRIRVAFGGATGGADAGVAA
jgi:hypothetical protein